MIGLIREVNERRSRRRTITQHYSVFKKGEEGENDDQHHNRRATEATGWECSAFKVHIETSELEVAVANRGWRLIVPTVG